ncbi:MAG: DDE transposase, partial [Rikenellaceae bacterium]
MKITEIEATFDFTEYNYVKSHISGFDTSKLGILKSQLPIKKLEQLFNKKRSSNRQGGRPEVLHLEAQICLMFLKAYTNLSDSELIRR